MDSKTQLIQEQDSPTEDTVGPVAAVPTGPKIIQKKAKGHKDDITFKNRMGGSNAECL